MVRLLAALLLLCLLPALALAAEYAVVKGGRLNLRQYASVSSRSLGKYSTGTFVRVTGEPYNGFVPVRTLEGKDGYMSASYLTMQTSYNTGTVRYANGGYVNLRVGPSLDNAVIMRVTCGSTVYIQSHTGDWSYVYVDVGGQKIYGYMSYAFINTGVSSARVTTRNGGRVNVRSGPGSGFGSVGTLASGTAVSVLLKGSNWYMISADGVQGFMSTQYLSGTGATVGTNTGSTTTSQTAYVNNPKSTQVLNLRETPSQSARSIGQYRNGTKVKVVSKGSTWCEVYVGTRHGYMMTRYLSFNGSYVQPSYTQPPYFYVSPTPSPYVPYITPVSQQPSAPKAGDTITLTLGTGGDSTISVYNDAPMTSLKASYPSGKTAMMLQYGASVCMIYIDGGVAYVPTWFVSY